VRKLYFLSLITVLASFRVGAADWPNWRGPDHNGISQETGWSTQWPADGPKQLWQASVGTGFSSIAVAQGRAYTMGNHASATQTNDTIFCFDAVTGRPIWQVTYPTSLGDLYYEGGPSATPTVEGDRVYTISKEGMVYCLDAAKGTVVWTNNPATELGAAFPRWGYASSALVQGNLLIFNVGDCGVALDKASGKIVWNTGKGAPGYASAVPCLFSGTPAVAIFSSGGAYGVETKSGRQLWMFPFKTFSDMNIADLIVSGNDVFMSADYNHGAALARVKDSTATQVWTDAGMCNHFNSCVLLDGFLYGIDGAAGNAGALLKCLDFATGTEKWTYKGLGTGGLIAADHKLIVLSDKGELVVAPVSPQGFNPIARAQVLGGKCWTVPTLANGRIYCRNAKGDLVCLDVSGK